MEISKSQKNNQVMIYLGFEYLTFRTINGVVTWRCRQNRSLKCHSIIKTQDGNIVQQPTNHCHDSCPQKAAANVARSKMREDMKASVSATSRNVMGNVLSGLNNDVLAHMPKRSSIARNLLYHRKGNNLSNPKTINFQIPEKYNKLVLHDSGAEDPDRILVLGDNDLILELNKDTIYGDGTFDKVPFFYQLYTWHAQIGNSYPPCIYFLLQRKNLDTYNKMFLIMKLLVPDLEPRKVLVDFEKVCMNAVKIAFPHAEVKGCYFHLCQSLIRKINNVGLKTDYESNINIKITLKSLAALAFVPLNDGRNVFDKLADSFPVEDCYNEVLTYFFSTYIEGAAGRDPQFPIRIWNHYDAALERSPKTTNSCEGFHNALSSLFHCSHPSVWFLFDGLQRDLACHKLTWTNAQLGRLEIKKRKYETLHDMVATSVEQYEQIEDKLKYLRKLANLQ